jgi:hypothetical protein
MAASFIIAVGLFLARKNGLDLSAEMALVLSVALTTAVWIAVTFVTPPTDRETLRQYYQKVRPAGRGWAKVLGEQIHIRASDSLTLSFLGWVFGCTFVYSALFATGALLYGELIQSFVCGGVSILAGGGLAWVVPRVWKGSRPEPDQ